MVHHHCYLELHFGGGTEAPMGSLSAVKGILSLRSRSSRSLQSGSNVESALITPIRVIRLSYAQLLEYGKDYQWLTILCVTP